jgi:dTDP-glucose 4,6-dehydratase
MTKVLVTGSGSGLIINLLRKAIFEKQPYTFVSVDRISDGSTLNNIYVNKDHQFYFGNITDSHYMNILFEVERPDIVIHAAAETSNTNHFISSNVSGTQTIIQHCLKWGVSRLIYISDDKVYGQLKNEDDLPFKETAPFNPRYAYAASKAAGELLITAAHHSRELPYDIIRLSNVYGPRQPARNLIPTAINSIIRNEKIRLYGDGLQVRNWIHTYDACSAILTVLNSTVSNGSYNVSGYEYSNIEVIQKICNVFGKGHELITFVDPVTHYDTRRSSDSTKIRELGWKPRLKLGDGILETVEWFQRNIWALQ